MIPSLAMNDGHSIPQLGIGTWPLDDAQVADVVVTAVELGYRHIDTAVKYGNEVGVGEGIRRAGLDRAELFVTTKLDGQFQGDDKALAGMADSLKRLGLEQVDLLLMHWPAPWLGQYVSTWKTFEKIRDAGLARSIGVSNFKPAHLLALAEASDVVPAVNQIQLSPGIQRAEQRAYDAALGIVTQSWSPLGGEGASVLDIPALASIGEQYGKTPGQVVLRWHVQLGLVVIPKSASPARLAENLDIFDFELSRLDLEAIAALSDGPDAGVDSDTDGH